MTEEQIKQKAEDFIITRQNHIKYFSGEAVKILLKNFAEEILTEVTKELQEELEDTNILYRNSEKEKCELLGIIQSKDKVIKQLREQIEKMKNCRNCANYMISDKCPCFFRTGWCKNWEMTRSKK